MYIHLFIYIYIYTLGSRLKTSKIYTKCTSLINDSGQHVQRQVYQTASSQKNVSRLSPLLVRGNGEG